MKKLIELAEKRLDKMGFDEEEKMIVFSNVFNMDEFIEWLLTGTESEINTWFDLRRTANGR